MRLEKLKDMSIVHCFVHLVSKERQMGFSFSCLFVNKEALSDGKLALYYGGYQLYCPFQSDSSELK